MASKDKSTPELTPKEENPRPVIVDLVREKITEESLTRKDGRGS